MRARDISGHWRGIMFAVCLGVAALAAPGFAAASDPVTGAAAVRWTRPMLNLAATIPVQAEGRIKPLETYATFLLLRLSGQRQIADRNGQELSALEWLLDCIVHPELARTYRVLMVANDDVLDAIGLDHEGRKKRDRYSHKEVAPAFGQLAQLAREYHWIPDAERSLVQTQVIALARNVADLDGLLNFLEFGRAPVDFGSSAFNTRASTADALAIFPPPAGADDAARWMTPADLVEHAFVEGRPAPEQVEALAALDDLARAVGDLESQRAALARLNDQLKNLATARGEYRKIPLEVSFYRGKFFGSALIAYVLSFLLVAISWLRPQSKAIGAPITILQILATSLLVAGITMRCVIRGRPPVTTLYETILFVTAVSVLVAMAIEWMNRQGVGRAIASVFGVGGLFLANKFELSEAADTMPQLIAVLDTNFWLATHVTTVTIGYAAGLLAAAIAHVWVIGNLCGLKQDDPAFYRGIARMVYGVVCFGLLFSVVGTILGGIWANDSWGRFWGWDPKENGALMIVLWEIFILHARMGGYLKQPGICLAAIAGGIIVAFSWWGVNFLGIGLHSYGFPRINQVRALYAFYGVEACVLCVGILLWLRLQVSRKRQSHATKATPTIAS